MPADPDVPPTVSAPSDGPSRSEARHDPSPEVTPSDTTLASDTVLASDAEAAAIDGVLECHLHLLAPDRAQLWVDAAGDIGRKPRFDGRMELRSDLLEGLLPKEQIAMGSRLFDALLPEDQMTLDAYRGASRWARDEGLRLSLILHFGADLPEWLHELPWELLFDPRWRLALGRSESTAIERRIDMRRPKGEEGAVDRSPTGPVRGKLRLLVAMASPAAGPDAGLGTPSLDREHEAWTLATALKRLEDLVTWQRLTGPPTPENLRRTLAEGAFHGLHLVAHGRVPEHDRLRTEGKKAEVLLAGEGDRGQWVGEAGLRALLADLPELRLVTLVACHDGIETHADPFHGLPWRLVQGGVPAIIATRRALSVDGARRLTEQLYRCLALESRLDSAMSEVRDRLQHSGASSVEGWAPAHFVGRARGTFWQAPDPVRVRLEADTQALEIARLRIEQARSEQLHALTRPAPLPEPIEPRTPPWLVALLVLAVVTLGGLFLWQTSDAPWPFLGQVGGERSAGDDGAAPLDPEATRRALPLYEAACAEGDARSCARVGAIYEHGRAGSRDLLRAVSFYARACEGNEAAACYHQGQLLERSGESGEPSASLSDSASSEVVRLYEAACEGGDNRGCRRLALLRADLELPSTPLLETTEAEPASAVDGGGGESPAAVSAASAAGATTGAEDRLAEAGQAGADGPASPESTAAESPAAGASDAATEAGQVAPQVAVVDGERTELPADPAEGRKEALPPLAPQVIEGSVSAYEVGGTDAEGRAFARARGNVYRVDLPTELIEVEVWLDFLDVQDLTFTVLQGDRADGRFATVHSVERSVEGRGGDWYSSGRLDLALEPGRYYLVTVAWNGEAGYAYGLGPTDSSLPPQGTFFGWVLHGHTDLAPLLPEVESEVADRALYRQRLLTRHPYRVAGEARESSPIEFEVEPATIQDGQVVIGDRQEREPVADGGWRGNLLRLDRPVKVARIEGRMVIEGRAVLELRLYSSPSFEGTFEQRFQASTTVFGEGDDWYGIDLDSLEGFGLEADRAWAVLVSVRRDDGSPTDHFYAVDAGQELPFGRLAQGLVETDIHRALEAGPDLALYQQRWTLAAEAEPTESAADP